MRGNLFFVSDNENDDFSSIIIKLEEKSKRKVFFISSRRKKIKFLSWINGVLRSVKYTQNEDTIIFWYDFQAILFCIIAELLFLKRNVIILNILLKEKQTLKNKLVASLYKKILAKNYVKFSVTSKPYGTLLAKRLKLKKKYFLLHDPFRIDIISERSIVTKSVFCGGYNGRDWDKVLEVASVMKDYTFTIVAPTGVCEKIKKIEFSNVLVYEHVDIDTFNRLLKNCSFVLLPVNTDAPAGLLVMFQAGAYHKVVISNLTSTNEEYLGENRGVLIESNDVNDYMNAIDSLYEDPKRYNQIARCFTDFLSNECGVDSYVNELLKIIESYE